MCGICQELKTGELILKRFANFSVVFNRYPYLPGHLMIVLNNHVSNNLNLIPHLRHEFIDIVLWTQNILMTVLNTNSLNMGVNTGPFSGSSIPDHFHWHIVPRSRNDINFMAITTNNSLNVYPSHQHQQLELNKKIAQAFYNAK